MRRAFARFVVSCAILGLGLFSVAAQENVNSEITYTYDNLGRLIQEVHSDAPSFKYTYDAAGNRTKSEVVGVLPVIRLWNTNGFEAKGQSPNGKLYFGVWRAGPSSEDVYVKYETILCEGEALAGGYCSKDSEAVPNVDYVPVSGTVRIPAGPASAGKEITVPTYWLRDISVGQIDGRIENIPMGLQRKPISYDQILFWPWGSTDEK